MKLVRFLIVFILFGIVPNVSAQTFNCEVRSVDRKGYADGDAKLTVRCDTNKRDAIPAGFNFTITLPVVEPPPEICGDSIDNDLDGLIDEDCPVPTKEIWGVVDPSILGTCSAEVHDQWIVQGPDFKWYRTWHPQVDPSGCTYAHEHGDNPAKMLNAEIAADPVLFGYVGEKMNHEEAHEGFKVFIANPGDVNDEGRVNRVYSRSVFHMGTGGPKRFATQHHSAMIRLIHPEFNLRAFTQLMMDTGGVGVVCDPRIQAPTKDVVSLAQPCKLNSFYEIWSTTASVMFQGREIYRVFATPAVFDPVTVFNPASPSELVYAWDPRVDAIMNFPYNTRNHFRGCDRESYAQPGYWYNNTGRTKFYTDAMGNEVDPSNPSALVQEISQSQSVGVAATNDGLKQFKMRVNYCGPGLGLKN